MPRSSLPPSTPIRRRWPSAVVLAVLLALGVAAPSASAASGVVQGQAADAPPNEAPSKALDVVSASAVYNRNSAKMKATVQMAAKPEGDVDIQYGITQPGGACAPQLTLRTNIAKGTAQLYGNAGNVRKNATQSYAEVGTITASVTDADLAGKKNIDCFAVRVYGAGANHNLRDSLGPVAMAERPGPPTQCLPEEDGCTTTTDCTVDGSCPTCDATDPDCTGTCTDAATCTGTCTDDPTCSGDPCSADGIPVPTDPSGDVAAERGVADDATDPCLPPDGGPGGDGLQLSVRFYGIPKRLKRGRSYEIRIRIRNDGDADARKLKVRLTKKPGVAMSRRVASVSNVRSGKAITVHLRIRLTSRQAKRTVRVHVSGTDVDEQRSFVLKRRGAK